MNILSKLWVVLFVVTAVFLPTSRALADDTCIFRVADEAKPTIALYFDTGPEMEQVVWHPEFDDTVVWPGTFTDENGYAVYDSGIVPVGDATSNKGYEVTENSTGKIAPTTDETADNNPEFTIDGRAIFLPYKTDLTFDVPTDAGLKTVSSNIGQLRYSRNYLNWLFFSDDNETLGTPYTGDGSDLPVDSRMFVAKKAVYDLVRQTANKTWFSVWYMNSSSGASSKLPRKLYLSTVAEEWEDSTVVSDFATNLAGLSTVAFSPIAEGLVSVGNVLVDQGAECANRFVLLITPGVSSFDYGNNGVLVSMTIMPTLVDSDLDVLDCADYDPLDGDFTECAGKGTVSLDNGVTNVTVPLGFGGSTYLDDVAHVLYNNDTNISSVPNNKIYTYTVGFMGTDAANVYLTNVSNKGNGLSWDDDEAGNYHFTVQDPRDLSVLLLDAVNDMLNRTNTFTAPVVPVTRTSSGDRIYLSFFKPSDEKFWEGNVVKFGLNAESQIVDKSGAVATHTNGALIEGAEPYWSTLDWAADYDAADNPSGILNSARNIYTYLGGLDGALSVFNTDTITDEILGYPTSSVDDIINYIRGADVLDEDGDTLTAENRGFITGDVLHSEPLVYEYVYPDASTRTMIYFGANDGMLHAVNDDDGTEAWGFIPPHQLPRLKNILEGTLHLYFVDATPKIYHDDVNKDKVIDVGEQVILVCGERKGSTGYFALNVTYPDNPTYLWRINHTDISTSPNSYLAESWSKPVFGRVKTTDDDADTGTPVFFIGGGYNDGTIIPADAGKAVLVIDLAGNVVNNTVLTATLMSSVASEVRLVDTNNNGFINKAYAGDMGGQMWRLASFITGLDFPLTNENMTTWTAQSIFDAQDPNKKFFYPPSVTLERGYDLVLSGTGDRENPCDSGTSDLVFAVKDTHIQEIPLTTVGLQKMNPDPDTGQPTPVNLDDVNNNGWYYDLAPGEKMLAEGSVFYKKFYFTTFTPNTDPCVPGGEARLYCLDYKTGVACSEFISDDGRPGIVIGGGIPSKPVIVLKDGAGGPKLLISVGSTIPDADSESTDSESTDAGILIEDADFPEKNFFYIWWKELFD